MAAAPAATTATGTEADEASGGPSALDWIVLVAGIATLAMLLWWLLNGRRKPPQEPAE